MDPFPTSRLRNVAIAGHSGAGKTTLVEALAAHTGVVARPGTTDDGTTISDHDPEEIAHGISMHATVVPCVVELAGRAEGGPVKLNLVDTPGFADFEHDVATALTAVDLVAVVVSAVDGVEAGTESAWRMASALGLPRMVVVTKLDRDRADFDRVLTEIRERFGAGVAPLELPVGGGPDLRGVIDLLSDRAVIYSPGSTAGTEGPVPDDLAVTEHAVHEALVEGIVVGDDAMTERYLEGDAISFEELEASLAGGVGSGSVFPVVCVSAAGGVGIDRLAWMLAELCPSPDRRAPAEVAAGGETAPVACDPGGDPLLRVFKTLPDPYVGTLSVCRVLSGTIRPDVVLTNPRTRTDERLHTLLALRGGHSEPVPSVTAGDLVAIPKLAATATGDTLAPKSTPVTVVSPPFPTVPTPSLSIAVRPATAADDDKLMTGLNRLVGEDPSLTVTRVDETHQTLLGGAGDTQIAVALERLARRFGVAVEREEVRIPYRETISRAATAEGRYKKQTGGHGQFGVATVRLEPLARGEGFAFADEVVGGVIPRQFVPAVEKGVVEAMAHGGASGFPVVDVSVAVVDGKHHPVDSSEMSFKMAGALAFREALATAGSVVLEPVSVLEVTVPEGHQGDVLGDLHARRAKVQRTDVTGEGDLVVTATVPAASLARYAADLRSLTAGRGRFTARHDHYAPVPPQLAAQLAAIRDGAPSGATA